MHHLNADPPRDERGEEEKKEETKRKEKKKRYRLEREGICDCLFF